MALALHKHKLAQPTPANVARSLSGAFVDEATDYGPVRGVLGVLNPLGSSVPTTPRRAGPTPQAVSADAVGDAAAAARAAAREVALSRLTDEQRAVAATKVLATLTAMPTTPVQPPPVAGLAAGGSRAPAARPSRVNPAALGILESLCAARAAHVQATANGGGSPADPVAWV